jgi:hypothetical protein
LLLLEGDVEALHEVLWDSLEYDMHEKIRDRNALAVHKAKQHKTVFHAAWDTLTRFFKGEASLETISSTIKLEKMDIDQILRYACTGDLFLQRYDREGIIPSEHYSVVEGIKQGYFDFASNHSEMWNRVDVVIHLRNNANSAGTPGGTKYLMGVSAQGVEMRPLTHVLDHHLRRYVL